MRNRIIVSLVALAGVLMISSAALAQIQRSAEIRGGADHVGALPSVPSPDGWKPCPRCQNQADRTRANTQYKVAGHPNNPKDLSGVWGFNGITNAFATAPPMTAWGKEQFAKTIGDKNEYGEPLHNKDTSGRGGGSQINCDPFGWPRLYTYNYGFEFVMLPDRVLQFFEQTHTWRTIWTDGRKLPAEPPEPHWMGWNVGHWEGDTFVVESNGFDERSWLNATNPDGGWPHSDEMKVVERWRRVDYSTLESRLTVTDPKTYTQPWVTPTATTKLVPGTELGQDFCAPSDYSTFNNEVFLPTAITAPKK